MSLAKPCLMIDLCLSNNMIAVLLAQKIKFKPQETHEGRFSYYRQ